MTIVDTIELYTKKLYLFMCMGALFACMSVCCACLVPWEARKGVESPETGVADRCKMPCRCWELNPASLEEKPVVLITGPAFQPANYTLLKWSYILWKFCNPPVYQEFICSTFGELLQVSKKGGRKPISMRWECVQRTEVRTRLHWSSFIDRSLGSKPHLPFSILGGAIGKMVTDCD